MEIALAAFFNPRVNLIVPNISWGMNIHECDLFILSDSGYLTEVEIKVSKADLITDQLKKHGHKDRRVKRLFFAVPEALLPIDEHIPDRAGIISVNKNLRCRIVRKPKLSKGVKFSSAERYKIARLGAMRIWPLKKKIVKLRKI